MKENAIIEAIREELQNNADTNKIASGQNFFKEKIELYGVKTAVVTKISKDKFKEIKDKPKEEIFALCEMLWESGYIEESFIACNWSYALHKQFQPDDLEQFEKWINTYVSNWASCDTLCNHTVGEFIEMYPDKISRLKEWTKSENRWMKRASAVTLIIPARKGKFLSDIFAIADSLLNDKDDLVQKGYGWMLKAAGQAYPNEIFNYVMSKQEVIPRTAFRYAIEKLPDNMKKQAMRK
jgi:3-methyladenine DNA glycosylase AlkD